MPYSVKATLSTDRPRELNDRQAPSRAPTAQAFGAEGSVGVRRRPRRTFYPEEPCGIVVEDIALLFRC